MPHNPDHPRNSGFVKTDGVDGSRSPASQCAIVQVSASAMERSHPMQVTTVGLDLAKNIFHVYGVTEDGQVAFIEFKRRTYRCALSSLVLHWNDRASYRRNTGRNPGDLPTS